MSSRQVLEAHLEQLCPWQEKRRSFYDSFALLGILGVTLAVILLGRILGQIGHPKTAAHGRMLGSSDRWTQDRPFLFSTLGYLPAIA
jgi:hypothetical protein